MNYFLVWGIVNTIFITAIKLTVDYNKWCDRKPINHKLEWKIVVLASLIPAIYFGMANTGFSSELQILLAIKHIQFWFSFIASGPMMAFFIWFFFDGLYNKFRGYDWWFTGSDDPDDAKTDDFLQKLSLWQHVAIKVVGLAIGIILYILTLK